MAETETAAGWSSRRVTKEVLMTTTHRDLLLRIVVIVTIKVKIKLIRKQGNRVKEYVTNG